MWYLLPSCVSFHYILYCNIGSYPNFSHDIPYHYHDAPLLLKLLIIISYYRNCLRVFKVLVFFWPGGFESPSTPGTVKYVQCTQYRVDLWVDIKSNTLTLSLFFYSSGHLLALPLKIFSTPLFTEVFWWYFSTACRPGRR